MLEAPKVSVIMQDFEVASLRRQVLNWRDLWLDRIPIELAKEFRSMLVLVDAKFDEMSYRETLSPNKYCERNIQPIFDFWITSTATKIMNLAHDDLQSIDRAVLNYKSNLQYGMPSNAVRKNIMSLGIASGSASAAVIGIPAVKALSTVSAGWGLGLIGITAISWPIALGGAAVLGTMAVFGGTKLAKHKEKSIQNIKETVAVELRAAFLATQGPERSLVTGLQEKIRTATAAYIKEIQNG